jgi:hypothetical protein
MEIQDARNLGFVIHASIEVCGQFRVMTTNRIIKEGENLKVMGQSPFYIYQKGEWKARVLTKNTKRNATNERDKRFRKESGRNIPEAVH